MKFQFATDVETFRENGLRFTRVRLDKVKLLFKDSMIYGVSDGNKSYASIRDYNYLEWKFLKEGEYTLVEYQELLFQLNRMLFEQAERLIVAAIDKEIE